MLSRQHRLSQQGDIKRTIRCGQRINTPHLTIYLFSNSKQAQTRAACIVSKKVHPSAVRRHTIQRWLRSITRNLLPQLRRSYDIVWIARAPITKLKNSQELYNEARNHLKKIIT